MSQWSTIPVPSVQTREELSRLVDTVLKDSSEGVEFELADVDRISTMTIQALVACTKSVSAAGRKVRLANLSEAGARNVSLLGLDSELFSGRTT